MVSAYDLNISHADSPSLFIEQVKTDMARNISGWLSVA